MAPTFNTKNLIQVALFLYANNVEVYHKERFKNNAGWRIFSIQDTWEILDQDVTFNQHHPQGGEPGTVDVIVQGRRSIRLKLKHQKGLGLSRVPMSPELCRAMIDAGDFTEPF
jgi:hypothetical protein